MRALGEERAVGLALKEKQGEDPKDRGDVGQEWGGGRERTRASLFRSETKARRRERGGKKRRARRPVPGFYMILQPSLSTASPPSGELRRSFMSFSAFLSRPIPVGAPLVRSRCIARLSPLSAACWYQ